MSATGSVVVLGGYGAFGKRIASELARDNRYTVHVAGRDRSRAVRAVCHIGGLARPLVVDCNAPGLAEVIERANARVVVHTAGPFQAQRYRVAEACLAAGAHYIDIADARQFVCGVRELDMAARRSRLLVVSGASSVPALSAAVVDRLAETFAVIEHIDVGITSGARPPGRATMRGALGYAGRPFTQWRDGAWQSVFGWRNLVRRDYPPPVGTRWLACCDVPDLDLFPARYPGVRSVVFRAGMAGRARMEAMRVSASLVRRGLLPNLAGAVAPLHRVAGWLAPFGSRSSAMHVSATGLSHDGGRVQRTWTLLAGSDHGPWVPTFSAIALTRKVLERRTDVIGATPCVGLLTVDEILGVGHGLDLHVFERSSVA